MVAIFECVKLMRLERIQRRIWLRLTSILLSASRAVPMNFMDTGANLTDPMCQGLHGVSQEHSADLVQVLKHAYGIRLEGVIVMVGSKDDLPRAKEIVDTDSNLTMTVPIQPPGVPPRLIMTDRPADALVGDTVLLRNCPKQSKMNTDFGAQEFKVLKGSGAEVVVESIQSPQKKFRQYP